MDSDPFSSSPKSTTLEGSMDPFAEKDHLLSLIEEYQSLLDLQVKERKELLEKIDDLTNHTGDIKTIDSKLQQFSALLIDIRQQISALSRANSTPVVPKPATKQQQQVIASQDEIEKLAQEVSNRSEDIEHETQELLNRLDDKKNEIAKKDLYIEELNDKLELLSDEKSRLAHEFENLNEVIDSWKNQLELLQKLAASDPRYKVIAALKKHGTLSDIQLAFTMGTSINQLRKYIEDLVELKIIEKTSNGRYSWTGKEFEEDF